MTTMATGPKTVAPARWNVDTDASSVEFAVKTFWGLGTVKGRFDRFAGTYDVGRDGAEIELTIDADSLDTGNRTRDKHLRSADFFHVAEHPQVRFTSTRVRPSLNGEIDVEGELEAAGKTVPLAFYATSRRVDDDTLELETTVELNHRRLGMSGGLLGMIRPPATLHVKGRVTR
jgi:polyisoprenoid-binding protein YceI